MIDDGTLLTARWAVAVVDDGALHPASRRKAGARRRKLIFGTASSGRCGARVLVCSGVRGILNSGYTRDAAFVVRTVGDDNEPCRFSTWAAKAVALIGRLPDTLASPMNSRSSDVGNNSSLHGNEPL